jgi:hypothetical protein
MHFIRETAACARDLARRFGYVQRGPEPLLCRANVATALGMDQILNRTTVIIDVLLHCTREVPHTCIPMQLTHWSTLH